ncbi:twin-arginine translocation signal domain-containing protein [Salmonella enterica]|nr:twin-arginine translocation signal domain-containing protein [Salmonella enterica]
MKTKIPDAVLAAEVSRRGLVKTTAIGGLAMASSAFTLPFTRIANAAEAISPAKTGEKVVWSACTVNCGSRCPLRMHVVDGEIKYVETDNTGNDDYDGLHQVRACLRGRSMRRRVYNPDRLKYPMKRVGARGEGKFERISWDEAYDIIATNMQRLIKEYGNESIYLNYGTGTLGGTLTRSWPPGKTLVARLMNCCGGYLNHYGDYSSAQIAAGLNYTYGGWADGNSPSDIENSKLVVLFGNNPGETRMSGGGVTYYLEQARQKSNARMIIIDPRYTDTGAGREDEWIPIRPGTDAALVNGLAYVLITENMVDQPFLDKYCVGYDEKTLPASAPKNGHYEYAGGDWQEDNGVWHQNVFAYYLSISCNHCEGPACTKVCPSGAMHKRDDGFVVVNEEVCIGCRYCHMACPYGAPQYNAAKGHMTKCDGCYDRVAEGKKPICVESCPLRALDFGPIDELRKKHGELAAVAPLPRAHFTKPNIVIKPNANSRPTGDTTGYLANPKEV